jgi:calpain-15
LDGVEGGPTYSWTRVKDLWYEGKDEANPNFKIFDDGVNSNDIKQGGLGDCYFLSAMSVIAHSRPELIKKIFHPQCWTYQGNGMYTVMFYRNREPVIITIDDFFPTNKDVSTFSLILLFS